MYRDPPKRELPNGSILIGKELELRSPKQCFREKDLYTTRFGHALNDDVEEDSDFEVITKDEFVGSLHFRSSYGSSLSVIGLRMDWLQDDSIQFNSLSISTFRH